MPSAPAVIYVEGYILTYYIQTNVAIAPYLPNWNLAHRLN